MMNTKMLLATERLMLRGFYSMEFLRGRKQAIALPVEITKEEAEDTQACDLTQVYQ